MREYHNFKGVPKLPGGMRNVKHPHILQECILSHPRGATLPLKQRKGKKNRSGVLSGSSHPVVLYEVTASGIEIFRWKISEKIEFKDF